MKPKLQTITFKPEMRNSSWKCYKSGFSISIYWSFYIKSGCLRREWVTRSLGSLQEHLCSCLNFAASGCCVSSPGWCAAWAESLQLPTEVTTTHQPAQPLAARRDTHQASPIPMEQSLLPWAPGCASCGEKLVSVLLQETSRHRTDPERHSFQQASKAGLSWDPQLQGFPLHCPGRAPLAQCRDRRSSTPMEPSVLPKQQHQM